MLRLWVDGVLALSHEVTMDLRKNSRYGGMAIGEFHLGGSPWGRGGEYFMDHVSFANEVLSVAEARAPCVSANNTVVTPTLLAVNAEHSSGPGANVIDGNVATFWNAGHVSGWNVPNWASFDFGAPQLVTSLSLYSVGDVTHDVKDWELQMSETGTDGWTTVASGVGVSGSDAEQTTTFDGVVSRYWRFYIPTRHTGFQAYVKEVVFYSNVVTQAPTTAPATLAPAMTAAPGTVNVVKELLRIALGVLFSLFDADTFLADLLALLSGQVTSGSLRWTCPESACGNGCPATSALKIAAGCNSHDSSVARNAQLLASGNVVVEFEPEYAEGNSADTVKLALDREAATPTTLAKYNIGSVDVVQGEVVIVHGDDSDDDLQAGYIVLIVAMVLLFLIVVIIVVVCLVTRKKKDPVEDKEVPNCPTNEVHDASV